MNARRTLLSRAHDERPRQARRARSAPVHPVLALQRAAGNQAVAALLSRCVQRAAAVSTPGDPFEREADQVADQVMRMAEPEAIGASPVAVQRMCSECEEEEEKNNVHRAAAPEAGQGGPELDADLAVQVAGRGGEPLPESVRGFFEPRFGADFSQVRVHTGGEADTAARAVQARAYTVGSDIVFGTGEYAPHTAEGGRLLAHELTHVVQQTGAVSPKSIQRACLSAADCAAGISGSSEEFVAETNRDEELLRRRRARMSPSRQRASGHAGPARQLKIFLDAQAPGLSSNVHGFFVDQDMSPRVAAWVWDCDLFTPPITGATKPCVFVPGRLNQEALEFNTNPSATTIGGRDREDWRISTLQTLTHEIQHVIYDTATSGTPEPSGVSTCTRGDVEHQMSELNAILSELPAVFDAVTGPATDPSRTRLADWWTWAITNTGESVQGTLKAIRCKCSCADADAFIRETVSFVTSGWPTARRDALNAELRQARWSLSWPL